MVEKEKILDMRDGNVEYEVKWKGYKKPTWEPVQNLGNAQREIDLFENVVESFRKFQKVSESFRKFQKVSESSESFRKFQKVSESFRKLRESHETVMRQS